MDGNQPQKQTSYSCRYCVKHLTSYEDFVLHERSHVEQMIHGQVSQRPYLSQATQNSGGAQSGPLESFHDLVQPFRTSVSGMDIRSQLANQGTSVLAQGGQDVRNNIQRPVIQASRADSLNMNPSHSDVRNMLPSSPADPRTLVAHSPVDGRNMVPSSPGDIRNMMASSPADHRAFAASSPADNRNLVASSPVDVRNFIPHSPASDHRQMVASSPIDQRNMMVSSPPDARMLAAVNHPDPKALARARSTDGLNMGHLSEQRAMISSSPVDQRNLMSGSPADPRAMNTAHIDQRSLGSPGMVPRTMVDSQDVKDADRRRIQSIVEDIRTLDSRTSADAKSFIPPNSMYRYIY